MDYKGGWEGGRGGSKKKRKKKRKEERKKRRDGTRDDHKLARGSDDRFRFRHWINVSGSNEFRTRAKEKERRRVWALRETRESEPNSVGGQFRKRSR